MEREARARALAQLLAQARLDDNATAERFARAGQPDYWRSLCREMTVESPDVEMATLPVPQSDSELAAQLSKYGYFHAGPAVPAETVAKLRRCVQILKREHWPPVFAFVYDQFWALFRTRLVATLLGKAIGSAYRQSAHIWVYVIPPDEGSGGWRPHADTPGADGRVSIWIPLSDATLENGCIYLIPKNCMPSTLPRDLNGIEGVNRAELSALLQGSRALPATAGSVLGWDHRVIHWGALATGAGTPRISVAAEFVGEARPLPGEMPLLESGSLPEFRGRLKIIGKALLDYREFEPLMGRYSGLATRLLEMV